MIWQGMFGGMEHGHMIYAIYAIEVREGLL